MSSRLGHRGYIGSRPYDGARVPQHVQNLVVRDYCQRNGFTYLLSATEYAMPGCYIMLEEVLRELPRIEGVVLYSLFMLPRAADRRQQTVRRILEAGATLHGAVENLAVTNLDDARRIEDIMAIHQAVNGGAAAPQGLDRP